MNCSYVLGNNMGCAEIASAAPFSADGVVSAFTPRRSCHLGRRTHRFPHFFIRYPSDK